MERYNVKHSCGHLVTYTAKHGITRDTWDTARFLAESPCQSCKQPARYQMPNLDNGPKRTLEFIDLYRARQQADSYIRRGATQVNILDIRTGETITVNAAS